MYKINILFYETTKQIDLFVGTFFNFRSLWTTNATGSKDAFWVLLVSFCGGLRPLNHHSVVKIVLKNTVKNFSCQSLSRPFSNFQLPLTTMIMYSVFKIISASMKINIPKFQCL